MEVEKTRSKGGFLNLFDWNGKSRKKLFANNSDLPGSNQGRENVENTENVLKSWLDRVEVDENGASSSNKEPSDYNSSLVTGDEGGGTRAPGVVARLMGLDSLPASNVPEPCSTPSLEYRSFRSSLFDRSNSNLSRDYHGMDNINMPSKLEKSSWNPLESRTQKLQNRPIERFQTEVLPPKSAKSIPVTSHRLLSPIKSPGYIATKNVAYIMEAAAKIMDASPRASTKNKVLSFGSSSVPLRIPDLRDKLEGGHRASRPERHKEVSAIESRRGEHWNRSKKGLASESKSSANSGASGSDSLRNKKKSVSLAAQAKVNVQRRDGSTLSNNRNFISQKEQNDVKSNPFPKNQPSIPRTAQKRTPANRARTVLRQNNQKQNSSSDKDSSCSKAVVSNKLTRKIRSTDGSVGRNKNVNEIVVNSETGAKKLSSMATHSEKELLLSKRSKVSQKKMSANGAAHIGENVIDDALANDDESSRKCNVAINGCLNWDNMKQGMDVISFTFTSPLRRCIPEAQSCSEVMGKYNDSFGDCDQPSPNNLKLSFTGLNATGADDLSALLQQKLQELTFIVDSSHDNLIREGTQASLASSWQDSGSNGEGSKSREQNKRLQFGLHSNKFGSLHEYEYSSVDDLSENVNQKQQFQVAEGTEEPSSCSNSNATREQLDCLHTMPASSFESSFGSENFSENSQSTNGSSKCSLEQPHKSFHWHYTNESLLEGSEMELSDSASSISMDVGTKHISRTFSVAGFNGSSNRELEYVREILKNTDLLSECLVSGQTIKLVAPNLFDRLNNLGNGSERNGEEYFKLGQKFLFDSVSECLDSRFSQILVGSCKSWAKWLTLSNKKLWLAEELYKEISGWKSMEDMLVDDLVEKDMSTQYGRWLDFDKEAFEEGVEIEEGILASLVDELVTDLLHL